MGLCKPRKNKKQKRHYPVHLSSPCLCQWDRLAGTIPCCCHKLAVNCMMNAKRHKILWDRTALKSNVGRNFGVTSVSLKCMSIFSCSWGSTSCLTCPPGTPLCGFNDLLPSCQGKRKSSFNRLCSLVFLGCVFVTLQTPAVALFLLCAVNIFERSGLHLQYYSMEDIYPGPHAVRAA